MRRASARRPGFLPEIVKIIAEAAGFVKTAPDRLQIDQKRKRLEQFLTASVHFAERSLTFLHRIDNINLNYSAMGRQELCLARLYTCNF